MADALLSRGVPVFEGWVKEWLRGLEKDMMVMNMYNSVVWVFKRQTAAVPTIAMCVSVLDHSPKSAVWMRVCSFCHVDKCTNDSNCTAS